MNFKITCRLNHKKGLIFFAFCICSFVQFLNAQVYSNKEVGKKNAALIDSLKNTEYPYLLPIWGEKARKKGFNLPYSAGIGINYLWQKSDLVIENLSVGFNHLPPRDLSNVIRFNKAQSEAMGINVRPDFWLFPFLNVYGILAVSKPSTSVGYGIYVPDTAGNWHSVIELTSQANFNATTFGFGLTPTFGVAGGWMALDMNFTWSDIDALSKPAFAFVLGPRFGKTFKFKKPQSNMAFWVGGFRLQLNTGTSGSLNIKDVLDVSGLPAKVDDGITRVGEAQAQTETWWGNLSPLEQKNPVNIAKYETANRAIERAGGALSDLDQTLNDQNYASVQYSLDKRPKDMWNFVLGTQYQYNKHWMLRLEYGFLGSRTQVIAGLQYRFGL